MVTRGPVVTGMGSRSTETGEEGDGGCGFEMLYTQDSNIQRD